MGTKANPSTYDCWSALEDDEPYFLLMARDPHAAELVRLWAAKRRTAIKAGQKPTDDERKAQEAEDCADNMEAWRYVHRADPQEKA